MFKIGDIVTPKEGYVAEGCMFKIIDKYEFFPSCIWKYKLQRITQTLETKNGQLDVQLKEIKYAEDSSWQGHELKLIKPSSNTSCNTDKINKEEKEMDILDLYKERKEKAIEKEYLEAIKQVKKDDEIQKIIIEMTNQVNTILENQGSKKIYEFQPSLVTLETELKIDELHDKKYEQIEELHSTLEEIQALFELTDDYEERIKILKNYEILNKEGKLNI